MKLNQDEVPPTIKEAVNTIVSSLSPQDKAYLRGAEPSLHFSLGMTLRNNWSLWEPDTPMKRDAAMNYGIIHPDDISSLILSWVTAEVKGELFDPKQYCNIFHIHWRKYGTTSLGAGGWDAFGPKQETIDQWFSSQQ